MDQPKLSSVAVRCVAIVGFFALGLMVLFVAIFYGINSGHLASIEALPQGKIPAKQLTEISQIVALRPNEHIVYFYSAAMTVSGNGNLFTNERVISYTTSNGQLDICAAEFSDIQNVYFKRSESWLDDSAIEVALRDGTIMILSVGTEQDGDVNFHAELMKHLNNHHEKQKNVTVPAPCLMQRPLPAIGR